MRLSILLALTSITANADNPVAVARFELHKGMVFADFQVNGKTVNLAVDSGSARGSIDLEKARELGLNIDKKALASGPHTQRGPLEIRIAENLEFALGEARFSVPVVTVYSLGFLAKRLGRPIDGIVGADLFRAYVVETDYRMGELRLRNPQTYKPPAGAKIVPVDDARPGLKVRGKVFANAGAPGIEGEFQLDTGIGGDDVVLWKPCADKIDTAGRELRTVTSTAFGGDRQSKQTNLARLEIGEASVENPLVRLSDGYVSGDRPSALCGNIGNGFLRRFNAIFDIPHGRLVLE
jgi:predicted aspartyl protease